MNTVPYIYYNLLEAAQKALFFKLRKELAFSEM